MSNNRGLAINVASLVADILVEDNYLNKHEATLIFDALAEGLIQQDVPGGVLRDIEAILVARIDEPGGFSAGDWTVGDPGDETDVH